MPTAADIHIAFIRGRAVALDLRRGRYLGLSSGLAARMKDRIDAGGDLQDALAQPAAGLAETGLTGRATTPPARAPAQSTLWPGDRHAAEGRPSLRERIAILGILAQVDLALRTRPLREVIGWLTREHGGACKGGAADLQRLLNHYWDVRPWFFRRPVCRLDAMSICLHLWRNGVDADLVFGVELDPFAAHCWVEAGPHVLNEDHDGVRRYAPIMVV